MKNPKLNHLSSFTSITNYFINFSGILFGFKLASTRVYTARAREALSFKPNKTPLASTRVYTARAREVLNFKPNKMLLKLFKIL